MIRYMVGVEFISVIIATITSACVNIIDADAWMVIIISLMNVMCVTSTTVFLTSSSTRCGVVANVAYLNMVLGVGGYTILVWSNSDTHSTIFVELFVMTGVHLLFAVLNNIYALYHFRQRADLSTWLAYWHPKNVAHRIMTCHLRPVQPTNVFAQIIMDNTYTTTDQASIAVTILAWDIAVLDTVAHGGPVANPLATIFTGLLLLCLGAAFLVETKLADARVVMRYSLVWKRLWQLTTGWCKRWVKWAMLTNNGNHNNSNSDNDDFTNIVPPRWLHWWICVVAWGCWLVAIVYAFGCMLLLPFLNPVLRPQGRFFLLCTLPSFVFFCTVCVIIGILFYWSVKYTLLIINRIKNH